MKLLAKGPVFLLVLAFVLAGAKSPIAFAVWAVAAFAFALAAFMIYSPPREQFGYVLLFMAGITVGQIYSLDPVQSLFWSAQCLTFSCLWLALQAWAVHVKASDSDIWPAFWILAAVTCLLTTFQWKTGRPTVGFLPLNRNFNAVWMAAFSAALSAKKRSHYWETILIIWLAALVILDRSRSGLLGLIAGFSYAAIHRYRRDHVILGLGGLGAAALLLPHAWLLGRMGLMENGARLRIWIVALKGMIDYPLTGYGLGNFELSYLRHAFPFEEAVRYGRTTSFAHNDYLQWLCELGWPTAGLLFLGLYKLFFNPIPPHQPSAAPMKAILIVLGVGACFNPIFRMPILIYLGLFSASFLMPREQGLAQTQSKYLKVGIILIMSSVLLSVLWCGTRSFWISQNQWGRVLTWSPNDSEAWHELGYQSTNQNLALDYHRKAVRINSQQPYYLEALARTLEARPEHAIIPQAMEMYLRAIQLAPTRAINHLAIARLLLRGGEPSKAIEWIERARALEPYYWECDLWLARCLASMGEKKRAIFVLKHLVQRHRAFVMDFPMPAESSYEQVILNYSEPVVQNAISKLL